jgi:hypothetical protein
VLVALRRERVPNSIEISQADLCNSAVETGLDVLEEAKEALEAAGGSLSFEVEAVGVATPETGFVGAVLGFLGEGETLTGCACCSNMANLALMLEEEGSFACSFFGVEGNDAGNGTSLGSTLIASQP